jgi:hypothetical protein
MATYITEVQWGGPDAPWRPDADLEIMIINSENVIPADGPPSTGTQVTWSSREGNGSVTFFDNGVTFGGSKQSPSEGPVGYRGRVK